MRNKKGTAFLFIGILLIAAALFLTSYNLYDELRAQKSSREAVDQLEEYFTTKVETEDPAGEPDNEPDPSKEIEIPDYVLNSDMEMPVKTINGIDYIGVLRFPVLDLELPVISKWSYPGLKIAPCRYSGSAYSGGFVIAGHNYKAHFGALKNLVEGDPITFTDMDGNTFAYKVALCEVLNSTDVDEMTNGEWDLTLFTCTLGGFYRVTVRCELERD